MLCASVLLTSSSGSSFFSPPPPPPSLEYALLQPLIVICTVQHCTLYLLLLLSTFLHLLFPPSALFAVTLGPAGMGVEGESVVSGGVLSIAHFNAPPTHLFFLLLTMPHHVFSQLKFDY